MLTFLCGLEPDQWHKVHQTDPAGVSTQTPAGYHRAGLYEGKAHFWLIQSCAGNSYRFWNYGDVFTPPVSDREYDELIEIALKARDEASQLRQRADELQDEAEQLDQVAADAFRAALIGAT